MSSECKRGIIGQAIAIKICNPITIDRDRIIRIQSLC